MSDIACTSCGSPKHRECCHRCGSLIKTVRRGQRFCTIRCEEDQADEDADSAAIERHRLERSAG